MLSGRRRIPDQIRLHAHSNQIRGLGEPNGSRWLDRQRVKQFTVGGDGPRDSGRPCRARRSEQTADEARGPAQRQGGHGLVGVAFPKRSALPEGVLEPRLSVATYEFAGDRDSPMSVESIQISGLFVRTTGGPAGVASSRAIPARQARSDLREESPGNARPAPTPSGHQRRHRPASRLLQRGAAKGSFEAGIELARGRCWSIPTFFRSVRSAANASTSGVARGAISSWPRASRSSCGAAFRTTSS